MSDRPQTVFAFPRPGPALKVVLGTLAALWLVGAIVVNWIPGGEAAFMWLVCTTDGVRHLELWRLFTAGLLTKPGGPGALSHILFTLVGLYFLSPDLERRWGSARFVRFLATCVVVGYALAVGFDVVAHARAQVFHPAFMFGAAAAITGTAIAWARENAEAEIRLFFFLPIKGKWLFWITVGYCVLGVISGDTFTEGAIAPFGGIVVALLLGGSPSAVRALYLRTKLAMLRKQGKAVHMPLTRPSRRTRGGSPPLRVVHGGLEEELKKREPPKDKRYLN